MIVKIILSVQRGVTLTDNQREKLEKQVIFSNLGKKTPTRKLYMALIDHKLINKLLDFLTTVGFNPILHKVNRQDGLRIGFKYDEEGNVSRDTDIEDLLPDNDISSAFPMEQLTIDGVPQVRCKTDENGEDIWIDSGDVDSDGNPIMVQDTEPIMIEVKPPTYMGWA